MAFTGPSEDRQAIRELYGAFGDASSRGHREDWLACWDDTGRWKTHLFDRQGKAQLREQWDLLWTNFDKVAFLGEVGAIEVNGDEATGRSIAREIIVLSGGGIYKLVGRYEDRFVRRDGRWLFARREYQPIAEELPK